MKRLFTAILVMLFAVCAQAAAPIAQIQAILEKPKILCGNFNQTKELIGISKPLLSQGRFCIDADKGVLWRTIMPFPNTLCLTRDEISQIQGNQTTMRLDANQEPVVRMINSVLFSLLAGDFSKLDNIFMLNGKIQDQHWQVRLKVRDAGLAKVIGNISLEGDQHVRKVVISESNGDHTVILFSNIKSGNTVMTADEEKLFE
jgi:hypothetical protein